MTTLPKAVFGPPDKIDFLAKERTIAGPGFNRWLLPPAALAIHLCIGMAYGFSVFWLPLSRAIGLTAPRTCPGTMGLMAELFVKDCDWRVSSLGWIYTLFFIFLGSSAAMWGGWVERAGPRKAGFASALCWCGGLTIAAFGVRLHQLWVLWVGLGMIGGLGLGLGYISPVSMLIKWFPDRRGMATGMAIMGFGGGAMIGSPLATELMKFFASSTSVGVGQTFLALAGGYAVFMTVGAFGYRLPAPGWVPAARASTAVRRVAPMITSGHVHVKNVWRIPQFWLVWLVLCLNVSAGISVIGMASPMLQEVFGGGLIGVAKKFGELDKVQLAAVADVAAGFTALLSLFNIMGRFCWASLSDKIGRKTTYVVFFVLGTLLYCSIPVSAGIGNRGLFVAACCLILSMYGGGFATVPAYLADLFGAQMAAAIHGRLLTAWSTAGVIGPVLMMHMRDYELGVGLAPAQVYDRTMYILAGMLLIGLFCNGLICPLDAKWFMSDAELARERHLAHEDAKALDASGEGVTFQRSSVGMVVLAWIGIGSPLAWGFWRMALNVTKFFH